MLSDARIFHLYKIQFSSEETLFRSSEGIFDIPNFVYTVITTVMNDPRAKKGRWVIADSYLDQNFGQNLLYGKLTRRSRIATKQFDEDSIEIEDRSVENALALQFVLTEDEFFLIESSSQIDDKNALTQFAKLFARAAIDLRQSKLLSFEPVRTNEAPIEQLKKQKIKKFTATIRRPNGEINDAMRNLFEPLTKDTNADQVNVTWESKKGNLTAAGTSAIESALDLSKVYGSWKAIPLDKNAPPISSDKDPNAVPIKTNTRGAVIASALAFVAKIRETLSDKPKRPGSI